MSTGLPGKQEDNFYVFRPFQVPKHRVEFQRAGKLADIPGYVWYTPAPLYLWGRYTETNLSDLVQNQNIQIAWYQFDKPVFQGFQINGDASWNHILWAAKTEDWKKIVDGILETVQFDIPNSRLYQYAMQNLKIYDPLALDISRVLTQNVPTTTIHAFAVLTNERQYAFDVRSPDVRVQPSVMSFKPSDLHVNAARKLFARKNMTQDGAVERYKEILLSQQDLNYQQSVKDRK
jgi:hypothetical protein